MSWQLQQAAVQLAMAVSTDTNAFSELCRYLVLRSALAAAYVEQLSSRVNMMRIKSAQRLFRTKETVLCAPGVDNCASVLVQPLVFSSARFAIGPFAITRRLLVMELLEFLRKAAFATLLSSHLNLSTGLIVLELSMDANPTAARILSDLAQQGQE